MKWTKHSTNASTSDPTVNRLEEVFGVAGYAMYFKLQEVIGGNLEHKEQPPTVTLSPKQWAKLLKCRGEKLYEFFRELEEQGKIILEVNDNSVTVTMPSIRESLDNRAASSAIRATVGPSEKNKKHQEEKALEIDKTDNDDLSLLNTEDHDRLKLALSQSGKEAIEATAKVVEEIFSKFGNSEEILSEIEGEIHRHFNKNEKTKALGESVWASAKCASTKGIATFNAKKKNESEKMKIAKNKSKEKDAPNSTDRICRSVIERWNRSNRRFAETNITFDELEHFVLMNDEYWGERTARSKFAELYFVYETQIEEDMCDEHVHEGIEYDEDEDWDASPGPLLKSSRSTRH